MRRILLTSFLAVILLSLFSLAHAAEYKNPDLLVNVETLKKNKDRADWVIVDTRGKRLYDKGHIPGAINLGGPAAKVLRDKAFRIKKVAELEKILGGNGIDNSKHVVIYGSSKITGFPPKPPEYTTPVLLFVLEYLGHEKVSLLNGGIETWVRGGNSLETKGNRLPPAKFKANVRKSLLVTTPEMIEIVKKKDPAVVLIDVREPKLYHGKIIMGLRGGHIPGAINISRKKNYAPDTGKFLPAYQLSAVYKDIPRNKRVVLYCYSGTGVTHSYIGLRLLGYDVAIYDDSWLVWGSNLNLPVEEEIHLDVFGLVKDVKKIKKQIKELREQTRGK